MPARLLCTLVFTALSVSTVRGEIFRVGSGVHCTHPTLAAALAAAVANGPGHDEIRLTIGVETTNAAFVISDTDVLIAGGYNACGVVSPTPNTHSGIIGNSHDSVFYIDGGRNVELRQLQIVHGGRHGVANGDFAVGGGVWLNRGTALLTGVRVMLNRARLGGGLAVTGNSVMVIYAGAGGSEIRNNEAMLGGGIYVGNNATLRIENDNVQVVHNAANGSPVTWENSGGGIYAVGGASSPSSVEVSWLTGDPDVPMTIPRGFLLANNTTTGNGGGLALYGTASFTAVETTIRDNVAGDYGGGIHAYGAQLIPGAVVQMYRLQDFLPGWLRNCEGLYGCNAITGNVARQGGGVLLMHGHLRLGQMLMAGNRSTDGGGAAVQVGSIANVPQPVNQVRLDSMVIAGNECAGTPSSNTSCSTVNLSAGSSYVRMQHVTLADNTHGAAGVSGARREINFGQAVDPLILRSTIIEPQFGTEPLFALGSVDADCIMAPMFNAIGTRALVRTPPYGFVSRATRDYRLAPGDPAIDACDATQVFDAGLAGDANLVRHGSVDDPAVANRLGPDARSDLGALERVVELPADVIFQDDFEG